MDDLLDRAVIYSYFDTTEIGRFGIDLAGIAEIKDRSCIDHNLSLALERERFLHEVAGFRAVQL